MKQSTLTPHELDLQRKNEFYNIQLKLHTASETPLVTAELSVEPSSCSQCLYGAGVSFVRRLGIYFGYAREG